MTVSEPARRPRDSGVSGRSGFPAKDGGRRCREAILRRIFRIRAVGCGGYRASVASPASVRSGGGRLRGRMSRRRRLRRRGGAAAPRRGLPPAAPRAAGHCPIRAARGGDSLLRRICAGGVPGSGRSAPRASAPGSAPARTAPCGGESFACRCSGRLRRRCGRRSNGARARTRRDGPRRPRASSRSARCRSGGAVRRLRPGCVRRRCGGVRGRRRAPCRGRRL